MPHTTVHCIYYPLIFFNAWSQYWLSVVLTPRITSQYIFSGNDVNFNPKIFLKIILLTQGTVSKQFFSFLSVNESMQILSRLVTILLVTIGDISPGIDMWACDISFLTLTSKDCYVVLNYRSVKCFPAVYLDWQQWQSQRPASLYFCAVKALVTLWIPRSKGR